LPSLPNFIVPTGLHVTASHFRRDSDLRIATPDREVLVERGDISI
jgi:hypothetical protein